MLQKCSPHFSCRFCCLALTVIADLFRHQPKWRIRFTPPLTVSTKEEEEKKVKWQRRSQKRKRNI
ncbi:Uncharacterized protein APZ42_022134 [Daphnia magna]|uniref:Uncharacterized protein n=1 Tax=Daphnia magna TaxID=35525 RepID=A0A0P5W267_9CRUS|nr:Uncharacterized protein APZ42_022134 [Daphnia magna]